MAAELQDHEHGDLRWRVIVTNNPHASLERIALIDADVLAGLIERTENAEAEAADQRERAEMAEQAILNAIAAIKTINLEGECPPDPSEWNRGYWACVHKVVGTMQAPYMDLALDQMRKTRKRVEDELRKIMGDV